MDVLDYMYLIEGYLLHDSNMMYTVLFGYSETLLFLHQIFLKGLCARLENWPTLVLGELLFFAFYTLLIVCCLSIEFAILNMKFEKNITKHNT